MVTLFQCVGCFEECFDASDDFLFFLGATGTGVYAYPFVLAGVCADLLHTAEGQSSEIVAEIVVRKILLALDQGAQFSSSES